MNRGRFNSPIFSSFGHNNNNSPDMNLNSNNAGFRNSMSPDFIPFEYSSPLSTFKNNDNRNRRKYHRGTMRMHDRSFNSPQSGGSSFNSPYNSSGYNHSGDFRKSFNYRQRNNQNPNSSAYNSKMYFNESMIKDPWEDLEKKFKDEKEINVVQSMNDNDLGSESDEMVTKIDDEDADRNSSSDEKDDLSTSVHTTTTTLSTTNSDS